jgi:hypothetical protein
MLRNLGSHLDVRVSSEVVEIGLELSGYNTSSLLPFVAGF